MTASYQNWALNEPRPSVLFYGVYSEGYRVGGTNRGRGIDKGGPLYRLLMSPTFLKTSSLVLRVSFGWRRPIECGVLHDGLERHADRGD